MLPYSLAAWLPLPVSLIPSRCCQPPALALAPLPSQHLGSLAPSTLRCAAPPPSSLPAWASGRGRVAREPEPSAAAAAAAAGRAPRAPATGLISLGFSQHQWVKDVKVQEGGVGHPHPWRLLARRLLIHLVLQQEG
jgi:hypothetical protein